MLFFIRDLLLFNIFVNKQNPVIFFLFFHFFFQKHSFKSLQKEKRQWMDFINLLPKITSYLYRFDHKNIISYSINSYSLNLFFSSFKK
jgi:hypothetical protein